MAIKNATIYRAHLPDIEAMRQHASELAYRELLETESRRVCFVENPHTNDLIADFPGGYAVTVRVDEKVLPSSVVYRHKEERCKAAAEKLGRDLTPEETEATRADAYLELCKQALVEHKLVSAYYDIENNLLVVNAASRKDADTVLKALIMATGSVKTQTINISSIKSDLATRLMDLIEADPFDEEIRPFGKLGIDDYAKLERPTDGEGTEQVTYQSVDIAHNHNVLHHLRNGYRVQQLGMVYEGMYFRLTHQFQLKGLSFNIVIEDDEGTQFEDEAHRWRTTAMVELGLIREVVEELCELMEYKAPDLFTEEEKQAQADKEKANGVQA